MDTKVREFFARYEQANAEFEVAEIASLYADVFLFGGPKGAQSIKKDDFIKVLPRRKEFFKSIGLVSSKVERIETSELDSHYILAKVVWRMLIERKDKAPADIQTSASYLLFNSANSFQIVLQVDHQDLAGRIQELG
ncbi:MAG TPA: hypothetical protein VFA85_16265 [Terriglobales bacterium]|nr:hypothetical protein [Terriglobales bacterium]